MPESYARWRLPELWQMVAADNAADAHLHLATLRRQQTALETQRDRLRTLRDQLAEGWPPEKSEAATAFLQRINDMIDAMTLTARGAGEVRINLVHVVDAIGRARAELEPLVAEYERAQAAVDPRVGRQAQRLLDKRARTVLVNADATVAQALGLLNVPLPDYRRFSWDRQEESESTPPLTGVGAGGAVGVNRGGGTSVRSLARSDLLLPGFDPPDPSFAEDDFGLAGLPDLGNPRSSAPVANVGGFGSAELGVRTFNGPADSNPGGLVLRGPLGNTDAHRSVLQPMAGRAVTAGPATGVPLSAGGGRIFPGAGSGPVRRGPSADPRSGTSAASIRRTYSDVNGHRDQSFEDYVMRRRAPQNDQGDTWAVKEGVVPLIEAPAPADRDHDPGLGVLGIDR